MRLSNTEQNELAISLKSNPNREDYMKLFNSLKSLILNNDRGLYLLGLTDDFAQECYLELLKLIDSFDATKGHFYMHFIGGILNANKRTYAKQNMMSTKAINNSSIDPLEDNMIGIDNKETIKKMNWDKLKQYLSKEDFYIIHSVYVIGTRNNELSKELNITPQRLSDRRKKIEKKLKKEAVRDLLLEMQPTSCVGAL